MVPLGPDRTVSLGTNDGACTAPILPWLLLDKGVPRGLLSSSFLTIFCFPFTPRVIFAAAFTASCHSLSICSWSGVPGLLGLPTLLALSTSFSTEVFWCPSLGGRFSSPRSGGDTTVGLLSLDSAFFC